MRGFVCIARNGLGLRRAKLCGYRQEVCSAGCRRTGHQGRTIQSACNSCPTFTGALQFCKRQRRRSMGLLRTCHEGTQRATLQPRRRMPDLTEKRKPDPRVRTEQRPSGRVPAPNVLGWIPHGSIQRILRRHALCHQPCRHLPSAAMRRRYVRERYRFGGALLQQRHSRSNTINAQRLESGVAYGLACCRCQHMGRRHELHLPCSQPQPQHIPTSIRKSLPRNARRNTGLVLSTTGLPAIQRGEPGSEHTRLLRWHVHFPACFAPLCDHEAQPLHASHVSRGPGAAEHTSCSLSRTSPARYNARGAGRSARDRTPQVWTAFAIRVLSAIPPAMPHWLRSTLLAVVARTRRSARL